MSELNFKLSSDSLTLSGGSSSPFSSSTDGKIFDLEKDFEELLDKLVIEDPVKRKQMLALPDASKKVLLEQQHTYRTVKSKSISHGSGAGASSTGTLQNSNSFNLSHSNSAGSQTSELDSFDDVKSVISSLLNSKTITIDLVKSLRVHLNTADRDWLKSFLDFQGVKPLLDILSKVFLQIRKKKKRKDLSILQFECLRCLASLMHIKIGMEYIASYPQAASLIVLGLESPLVKVKTLALELLAAIAITDKGHPSVITAMIFYKEIKKEDTRYSSLVKSLKTETTKEYLASCMSFINCIISSPSDLHVRMDIRKAFVSLKISKYIHLLRSTHTEYKLLTTQLDVFEEETVTDDQLNIKEHENDVKVNVLELFSQIFNRVTGTESEPDLTALVVHFQRMASSQLGNRVWKLYNTLSSQLESELSSNPDFDVGQCNLLFGPPPSEKKKSLFSFGNKSKSPTSSPSFGSTKVGGYMDNEKLRKDSEEKQKTIDHLLKQLNSFTGGQDISKWQSEREEKNRIIQELMKTQSVKQESPDVEQLKNEIQALKLEIERIKHNPPSPTISHSTGGSNTTSTSTTTTSTANAESSNTGTEVPSTTTSEQPQDTEKPKEEDGTENISGGPPPPPPPPPPGGGPPPPPPPPMMGGGPPPPPPPGMKKPSRPPKPVLKPSVKMRNFNWVTIPVPKVEGTFWDKVDESIIVNQLDKTELEYLFSAKAMPAKSEIKVTNKKVAITLIDMKKANNCAIMLQHFKLGNQELKRIQSQMDETILTLENTQYLLQFVPSKEDIEALKEYTGDVSLLGAAEQYMLQIMDIPKLEIKLKAHIFKLKFPSLLDELIPDIKAVRSSSNEVKSSRKLSEILKYVLGIGNYINGSTNRGGAFGFKLETLAKMRDAKGNDGRMSILHFLSKTIQDKAPELLTYHSELSHLEHASEVSINNINSDTAEIKKGLDMIDKEFVPLLEDPKYQTDQFVRNMVEFGKKAKEDQTKLQKELDEMNKQYESATTFFGDSKVTPPDQFFSVFNQFLEDLDKAHKEYLSFLKKDQQEKQQGSKYDDPEKGGFDDLTSHIRSGKFFQERRKSSNLNHTLIQQVQQAQLQHAVQGGSSSGSGNSSETSQPSSSPNPPTGFKLKPVNKQPAQPKPETPIVPASQSLLKPSALRNSVAPKKITNSNIKQ
ncbi:actin binding protein [Tieghemostelium lacteum]|uniref:Actin binding protein n=1 Tax=Tieghemostelium lacteum TaxID=361077 RepID=A0A151ZCE6_TIELA|nr:actin binding protein [Tieghemostelium lacteum]|eukprot:KYQ91554.1 actin binding protein [Tieghemostelium lacteum]